MNKFVCFLISSFFALAAQKSEEGEKWGQSGARPMVAAAA
jgi:hypothetical protein